MGRSARFVRAAAALLIFFSAPLNAERREARGKFISYEEELAARNLPWDNRTPMRLASDAELRRTSREIGQYGLSPAGESVAHSYKFSREPTLAELNVMGRTAVEYVLEAGDRANMAVIRPGGTMTMIESKTLQRAVFYHKDVGFVGMVDLRAMPAENAPAFTRMMTKMWERAQARSPPEPYGQHKPFFSPTPAERSLAEKAHSLAKERQSSLRRQGFLPVDEVAGGTPYVNSNVDGWVMPMRDGAKTFPQTE